MQFTMFQEARCGARHSNQDRIGYVYTNDCLMMVVCDGMGGHARGEIASQIAVDSMAKSFRQSAAPTIKDPATFLARSITTAHEAILSFSKLQNMPETPRTTCVAAIVQDGSACWAHVGDSRLYMLRAGVILARTVDHSHVQSLVDQGFITAHEATVHPDRNKIYNCMGQPAPPRIDVTKPARLVSGDKLVLCSDGFWGPLLPELVAESLVHGSMSVNTSMLMDLAEALAGRECDNLSVVAMSWISNSGPAKATVNARASVQSEPIGAESLCMASKTIRLAACARPSFKEATDKNAKEQTS